MYKGRTKKFRDTIHGYIEIPEVIVSNIIDTEQFQRLRCIEQTSMRPLYPAARHDRFIHSLGVYWLGVQAFKHFRKNAQTIMLEKEQEELGNGWWTKQGILFSLACLLHDCAHAPFSHTLEDIYAMRHVDIPYNNPYGLKHGGTIIELDMQLLEKCNKDSQFQNDFLVTQSSSPTQKGVGAPHEKMSSYCVMNEYQDAIKAIYKQISIDSQSNGKPDVEEITDEDIVFIVRMIIGCLYSEEGIEKSIKNCLISMLNSTSIDVDGLDYVVRDAYMSGIDTFSIDYQRLLSAFTLITVEVFENKDVHNFDMGEIWLKGSNFIVDRLEAKAISGSLTIKTKNVDDELEKTTITGLGCKINVEKNVCRIGTDDTIKVDDIRNVVIHLDESCKLRGSSMSGTINYGKRIVSNLHPSTIPGSRREYILGYEKNCLSVIQSTVEARNHEYLWVYTHPKVLYSSHYLQWELLRDSAKYLCCCAYNKEMDSKKLTFDCAQCTYCGKDKDRKKIKGLEEDFLLYIMGYSTFFQEGKVSHGLKMKIYDKLLDKGFCFYRTCDDDLNALFKRIYRENEARKTLKSDKIHVDFQEFFSRHHRKPLWKSFVEYDNFLKMCEENQQSKNVIPRMCKQIVTGASISQNKYAEPTEEQQNIFSKYGFDNALVIKASVKTKELNPQETFIKFKNQSLRLYDIFDEEARKGKMSKDFYYIFAAGEGTDECGRLKEMVAELDDTLKC